MRSFRWILCQGTGSSLPRLASAAYPFGRRRPVQGREWGGPSKLCTVLTLRDYYASIYTYITDIHVCTCIYIQTYTIYTCKYTYTYIHLNISIYVYIYTCTHISIYAYVCWHASIDICTYVCAHASQTDLCCGMRLANKEHVQSQVCATVEMRTNP